ncbi:MAG: hypothetical protein K2X27_17110 [Candidatus Obscuribacterales bacterium]|nr:hypothetical protein [Candidatus Obscuribacterales bacterium]
MELCDISELKHSHTLTLRWKIACYPETPSAVLDFLSKLVDEPQILTRVAENPNTAPFTLTALSEHIESEVRIAVAENKNTPIEVLLKLAKDESLDVRFSLAENHGIANQVLQELLHDDNPYISARAQRTIKRKDSILIEHRKMASMA